MTNSNNDLSILKDLNRRFIDNYINQDTTNHNEIIHKDFVCIENSGTIVGRDEYMKEWSVSYYQGGFLSFDYTDEHIRLFENFALVRSRTVYTKVKEGKVIKGSSVYTDTYIKENGRWWCIQTQITPIH